MPGTPRNHPSAADVDAGTHDGHVAKRRKVRKGTHSCWACKRRKEKCIFATPPSSARASSISAADAICIGCQTRGTQCVSQEYDENDAETGSTTLPSQNHLNNRLTRIETLLANMVDREDDDTSNRTSPSREASVFPTPDSEIVISSHPDDIESRGTRSSANSYPNLVDTIGVLDSKQISSLLQEALPNPADYAVLIREWESNSYTPYAMARLSTSYSTMEEQDFKPFPTLIRRPRIDAHPILIARHMLILANFLLQLKGQNKRNVLHRLSKSPRSMADRLISLVSNLVLAREELQDNIESIHCHMLASFYYGVHSDLRRSWIALRKALLLAQLFGLDQPTRAHKKIHLLDPSTDLDIHVMWMRILFYDRNLCLLLGLSQGSSDCTLASGPVFDQDTPTGRLERIHSDVSSQIIQRNSSPQETTHWSVTQALDTQLLQAARNLPSRWWRLPVIGQDENQTDWPSHAALCALDAQICHFSLLNQVHLPYMLRSTDSHFAYSRGVCVNAARELLTRYSMLHKFNQLGSTCRVIDLIALMAAMTLLLSHLNIHRTTYKTDADNLLAHQYASDRCLIEEAQEQAEAAAKSDRDSMSYKSADLLHRLLAVDNEIAKGSVIHAHRVTVQVDSEGEDVDDSNKSAIRVHIPYFGVINIARDLVTAVPTIPLSNFQSQTTDVQPDSFLPSDWQAQYPDDVLSNGQDLSLDPIALSEDQWALEGMNIAFVGNLLGGN